MFTGAARRPVCMSTGYLWHARAYGSTNGLFQHEGTDWVHSAGRDATMPVSGAGPGNPTGGHRRRRWR